MDNLGWVGPAAVLENYLQVVGADRDAEGKVLIGGPEGCITSYMGLGDEFCVSAEACYFVQGKAVPLAANMVQTIGQGAGRGLSCVVIS